jgi:hypothetical protein
MPYLQLLTGVVLGGPDPGLCPGGDRGGGSGIRLDVAPRLVVQAGVGPEGV